MQSYTLELMPAVEEAALDIPIQREMRGLDRDLTARFLDSEMRRLAFGRGVIEVHLGRVLEPLLKGGHEALGHSRARDYCTEQLGVHLRSAQRWRKLARDLERFPLVRQGLLSGRLNASQAALLQSYLDSYPEEEAEWVERAVALTVRGLRAALTSSRGSASAEEASDEAGEATGDQGMVVRSYALGAATYCDLTEAVELGSRVAGEDLSLAQVLEYMAADFVAGAPLVQDVDDPPSRACPAEPCCWGWGLPDYLEASREMRRELEELFGGWDFLDWSPILVELSPELGLAPPHDPHQAHDLVLRLLLCRRRLGWYLGRMLRVFANLGLPKQAGFASVSHYAAERLGLAASTTAQLIARERGYLYHPIIAQAVFEGRLTPTKAEMLFPLTDERNEAAWVEFAARTTCRNLKDWSQALQRLSECNRAAFHQRGIQPPGPQERLEQVRQLARAPRVAPARVPGGLAGLGTMPSGPIAGVVVHQVAAQGVVREFRLLSPSAGPTVRVQVRIPEDVEAVLRQAEAAARGEAGRTLTPEECLARWIRDFLNTWGQADREQRAQRRRLLEASGYRCSVPGCSARRNLHLHHVEFRSHGGGNQDLNLTVLCSACHLRLVHRGRIRVTGKSPDDLVWELGLHQGKARLRFRGEFLESCS